jgi:hypothetical protein
MKWMKRPSRRSCRNAHPCAGFAQKYADGSYHAKTNLTWRAVKNTIGLELKTVFDSSGLNVQFSIFWQHPSDAGQPT